MQVLSLQPVERRERFQYREIERSVFHREIADAHGYNPMILAANRITRRPGTYPVICHIGDSLSGGGLRVLVDRKIANQRQMVGKLYVRNFEPIHLDSGTVQNEVEFLAGARAGIRG
jgi:hypothetical protein